MLKPDKFYGLLAEFDGPDSLLEAAKKVVGEGYYYADAYAPFPIHGLSDALGFKRSRVSMIVLCGGIFGAVGGFFMQWYANVIAYPWNVGGRPENSWPAFIAITFEMTILGAALAAVLGMLALNRLPMPYHPLFNVPQFAGASQNKFFLAIQSRDKKFEMNRTRQLLESLHPISVYEVAN